MNSNKVIKSLSYSIVLIITLILNFYYQKQYFIEQWMRFSLRNEYIIISMSTTPYRINELEPTLKTLLHQNANIKSIYLNIPHVFKRDNLEYKIPASLANNQKIKIIRCDDYGPATKLLGVLEKVELPTNAIIVTVDDDVLYPTNLVLQLAYAAKQHPDHAIGIMGANVDYNAVGEIPSDSELGLIKIKVPNAQVSILQGYAGVAYRRSFFDTTIFSVLTAPRDCINSDDLYLSFYLAKHDITRQVLLNSYINGCKIMWQTDIGTNDKSLHKLLPKPTDKHRSCIAYLKQHNPDVVF